LQGLPSDALSIDNGILATRCRRWPLLIDPQLQGEHWIRTKQASAGLRSVRANEPNLLRTLESCVRVGACVLLEDIGETLDPALEPLVQKQVFTQVRDARRALASSSPGPQFSLLDSSQGNRKLIRLGDADVDYDPNFQLCMTTMLSNPHFLPEVCIKVTLINFTVTQAGLQEQLLADTIRHEQPALEEQRDSLVTTLAHDRKQLSELEHRILRLLQVREQTGRVVTAGPCFVLPTANQDLLLTAL